MISLTMLRRIIMYRPAANRPPMTKARTVSTSLLRQRKDDGGHDTHDDQVHTQVEQATAVPTFPARAVRLESTARS
jgi:hypothetical protein